MLKEDRIPNYNANPTIKTDGFFRQKQIFTEYKQIFNELLKQQTKQDYVITMDCYPGVDEALLSAELKKTDAQQVIMTKDLFKDEITINAQLNYHLTEDRVFGKMYYGELLDLMIHFRESSHFSTATRFLPAISPSSSLLS